MNVAVLRGLAVLRGRATRGPSGDPTSASPRRTFVDVLVGRVGTAALSLISIVLVARAAPTDTVGVYTASIGFALLLFMFLDLGSGQALVRAAASADDRHREIWLYLRTRAVLTLLTTAGGAVGCFVLFPPDARPSALVGMLVVLFSFVGPLAPVGQVVGRVRPYRNVLLIQGAVSTVLTATVLFAVSSSNAVALVAASAAGNLVGTIIAISWLARTVPPMVLRGWSGIAPHLRALAMLGLATGIGSVYNRIDTTLILRLVGTDDAAYYGIATRIIDQARVVPSTLLIPLGTVLAALYARNAVAPRASGTWLVKLGVLLGGGLAIGLIAGSNWATSIIGGDEYHAASGYVIVLGASLGASVLSYILVVSSIMAGLDRLYLSATVLSLIFNVVANVLLLPRYGAMAAAAITGATQLLLLARILFAEHFRALRRPMCSGVLQLASVSAAGAAVKTAAASLGTAADVAASIALVIVAAGLSWQALQLLQDAPTAGAARPD